MAKGGTVGGPNGLQKLGALLANYGSAISGNPLYANMALQQAQMRQQQAEEERKMRQEQTGNAAAMSYLRTGTMEGTPATRQMTMQGPAGDFYPGFAGGNRTVGQNRDAAPAMADPLSALRFVGAGSTPLQQMAAQRAISQIFPQGPKTQVLKAGETLGLAGADGSFKPTYTAPTEPAFKVGQTRDIVRGNALVTEEYQPDGSWKQIGSGPRWEAPQAPQKPFGYDEEQARKAEEAARKNRADEYAFKTTDEGFTDIMRSAAKLGTNPNLKAYTGGFDAMTPNFTAGAKQFASDLDVLKSNLAMNALNAARAGSATGATGFGALSEGELKILQNQIATLDPGVGPENFQRQIVDIIQKTKKMRGDLRSTRPTVQSAAPGALPGFKIEPLD